jgi:SAM-dependent methyltransferase
MGLEHTVRRLYRRLVPAAQRARLRWMLSNLAPALQSAPLDLVAARHGGLPVPGPRLRSRVGRDCSRRAYLEHGALIADSVLAALSSAGLSPLAGRRWLDFGCGSGRVARHLLPQVEPASFVGLDVDAGAIAWCQRHLPGRYLQIATDPPTPLPDASVDVVIAISVFSHLDPIAEAAWLDELRRLLAPAGLLLASTHSERLTWELPALVPEELERLAATGTLHVPGGSRFNAASTFHTRAYLERSWGERLQLLHFSDHGLAGYQDVSVWRRPP